LDDFDLAAQQSLDAFNFSDSQVGYVGEIHVGTTFGDVTRGVRAGSFTITAIESSSDDNMLTLTWDSTEGTADGVKWSRNMTNWDAGLDDRVLGDSGDSTTRAFDLTGATLAGPQRVFFHLQRQKNLIFPVLGSIWIGEFNRRRERMPCCKMIDTKTTAPKRTVRRPSAHARLCRIRGHSDSGVACRCTSPDAP